MTTTSTLANEIAPSLIQLGGLEQFASIYAELNQLAATTPQSEPETRDIELLDIRLPEPEGECDLTLVTDSRLPEPEGECDLTLLQDSDTFWFNPSSTGDNAAAFFADGLAPDAAPIELLSELLLCFEDTDLAYDTPYTVVAEASVDQFSDFNLI